MKKKKKIEWTNPSRDSRADSILKAKLLLSRLSDCVCYYPRFTFAKSRSHFDAPPIHSHKFFYFFIFVCFFLFAWLVVCLFLLVGSSWLVCTHLVAPEACLDLCGRLVQIWIAQVDLIKLVRGVVHLQS